MPDTTPPVGGPFTPASSAAPAATGPTDIFSSDGFLRILASQIRSQNPLEPMKDTEFIAQMAQFSQLEQMTALASGMEELALAGRLSQGAALVGRSVTYAPAGGGEPVTGVVESVTTGGAAGPLSLVVDGVDVDARRVTAVAG